MLHKVLEQIFMFELHCSIFQQDCNHVFLTSWENCGPQTECWLILTGSCGFDSWWTTQSVCSLTFNIITRYCSDTSAFHRRSDTFIRPARRTKTFKYTDTHIQQLSNRTLASAHVQSALMLGSKKASDSTKRKHLNISCSV